MKMVILLMGVLISVSSLASDNAKRYALVMGNLLTHHWSMNGAERFESKRSSDGRTIDNKFYTVGILSIKDDNSWGKNIIFFGDDSIGSTMAGYGRVYGFNEYNENGLNIGLILGGYLFDQKRWDQVFYDREVKTPSMLTKATGIRNINLIIGLNIDFSIKISNRIKVSLENVVTPMITTHSIGLGFSF